MPADTRYGRHTGPRDRTLRVGDAEREAVGAILRREHVNGRLDAVEFQERLDRALAAKTYADLDTLIADLPGGVAERPRRQIPFAFPLVPLAIVAAIVVTGHLFWLAVPLFVLFVVRGLGGPRRYSSCFRERSAP
jgi:DUF1707 SHOCT-like domain